MRLWKKLLIGGLALLFVLLACVVVFLSQANPNNYRGYLADLVEEATGRKLVLGGDLRIKLLPLPYLEANDIRFANAPWASQPDMVRVKTLRAELGLTPLLQGRLEIRRFEAIEPRLFLETDAAGKGNWQFGEASAPPAEDQIESSAASEVLDIDVEKIRVENASLDFLNGQSGKNIDLQVESLSLDSKHKDDPLELRLRATYQALPVSLDGRFGAPGAVRRNQPMDVDVEGNLGDAVLHIEGSVGEPLQGKNLRLRVALESPSTKVITDATGVEVEELGPVKVQLTLLEEGGRFQLDAIEASAHVRDTELHISGSLTNLELGEGSDSAEPGAQGRTGNANLQGNFGEARFSVVGHIAHPTSTSGPRLDVAVDTKSTLPLTKLAGIEFEEVGPVKLSFTLLGQRGRLDFDAIELSARPRDTEARLRGSVKNLLLDGAGAGRAAKPAKVDLAGTFADARFTLAGDIAEPLQGKGVRLNATVEAKSTRAFTDLAGVDMEDVGPLDAKLRINRTDQRFDLDNIDVSARPRGARIIIKGSVQDLLNRPLPDLEVDLSAKNLRQLDESLPHAGPVSLSARLKPSGKVIEIRELLAKIGKSDLSGSASVDTGTERPSARATLRAKNVDLREFLPPVDESAATPAADKPADGKIFPADPLPLDALKKFDAQIDLAVDRLVGRKITLDKVKVAASLDNGKLSMKPSFDIAGGAVGATVNVDSRAQPAKIAVDVDAARVSIGTLTKELRGYETSQGLASNLKLNLTGQGDSVRALMAGLDGDIRLDVGKGRLNNAVLERVGADLLTQIVSAVVPKGEEQKTTAFECAVLRWEVKKGVAVADRTLVMETEKVLLIGGGVIDLSTEDLDLGAKLAARKGIRIGAGTLSSLMRVQGTLAKPRIGTDLKGLAETGARVGIAVATAGLSLIAESVYGHVNQDEDPCQTALNRKIDASPRDIKAIFKAININ